MTEFHAILSAASHIVIVNLASKERVFSRFVSQVSHFSVLYGSMLR